MEQVRAYQHESFVHGPQSVSSCESSMCCDGLEQTPLHILDALAPAVAIIYCKKAHKIARLDLFYASRMVVLHVPPAPEREAVPPLNLDLWAAQQDGVNAGVEIAAGYLEASIDHYEADAPCGVRCTAAFVDETTRLALKRTHGDRMCANAETVAQLPEHWINLNKNRS